jgi:hypothetical protein
MSYPIRGRRWRKNDVLLELLLIRKDDCSLGMTETYMSNKGYYRVQHPPAPMMCSYTYQYSLLCEEYDNKYGKGKQIMLRD